MNLKKHLPWLGALLPIANTQAETKPNVVIIYIDDMGIGDIGCYGGKFVPTPNIDKLAQDGLLFNQYYSSAPVSSPSRCGLTTGLFPHTIYILSCSTWQPNQDAHLRYYSFRTYPFPYHIIAHRFRHRSLIISIFHCV